MENDPEALARQFEAQRSHLRRVAYRMLGSLGDAEDAVQETWMRLASADSGAIRNLGGWLTGVVSHVCLDMLRQRKARREEAIDDAPEVAALPSPAATPEEEAQLADAVGLALLVLLDQLDPAERIAFVLHDLFGLPFVEIAAIVGRTLDATRQLASRARRRIRGTPEDAVQLGPQRAVVDAFVKALRAGDVGGLLAVLDPDVVVRSEVPGRGPVEVRGAANWAKGAVAFAQMARFMEPAVIDGAVGLVFAPRGKLERVMKFTFAGGRIAGAQVISDAGQVSRLVITVTALPP